MGGRGSPPLRKLLEKACQVRDPLRDLPGSLVRHEGGGHAYTVRAFRACSIPHGVLEWCFQLCKRNMRELYESVWGWKDDSKRKQLEAAASRFLVAYEAGKHDKPVAFANYRFEEEEGEAVLYCYELQVAACAQQRGLGSWLVGLLEQIAWRNGMRKVMLTVFAANAAAVRFYTKQGYCLDPSSPDYEQSSGSGSGDGSDSSDDDDDGASSDGSGSRGRGRRAVTGSSPTDRTRQGGGGSNGDSSSDEDYVAGEDEEDEDDDWGAGSEDGSLEGASMTGYHILSKAAPQQQQQQQQQQQEAT